METYVLGDRLGQGGYGDVYACVHKKTGLQRAMKVVAKQYHHYQQQQQQQQQHEDVVTLRINNVPGTQAPETSVISSVNDGTSVEGYSNYDKNNDKNQESHEPPSLTTETKDVPSSLPLVEEEAHEFLAARSLDHPNLARVYECYEDSQNVYLIMDLYPSQDLLGTLQNETIGPHLSDHNAAVLVNALLTAVHYMHNNTHPQPMAHLDIKLENIMFGGGTGAPTSTAVLPSNEYLMRDVKLIDFGLSKSIEYEENSNGTQAVRRMSEKIGSTAYMAPQVHQQNYNPIKADIWSMGVCAFTVLTGYSPFPGQNDVDVLVKIMEHDESKLFADETYTGPLLSQDAKDFIMSLLAYDENNRPTAAEALEHPWLTAARQQVDDALNGSLSAMNDKEKDTKDDEDNYVFDMCQVIDDLLYDNSGRSISYDKNKEETPQSLLWKDATLALLVSQYGVEGPQQKLLLDDAFRAMDTHCTGVLSKEDLFAGIQRFRSRAISVRKGGHQKPILVDEDCWRIADTLFKKSFASLETTNDGERGQPVLTYSDFVACATMRTLLEDEDRLSYAFGVFAQGSDYITSHSLASEFQNQARPDETVIVDAMMLQIDSATPGRVSPAEFKAAIHQQAPFPMPPPFFVPLPPLTTLKESTSLACWEQILSGNVMDFDDSACFQLVEQIMNAVNTGKDESPKPLKRVRGTERDIIVSPPKKKPRRSPRLQRLREGSPPQESPAPPPKSSPLICDDSATLSAECALLLGSYPQDTLLPVEEYASCHYENRHLKLSMSSLIQ